MKKYLITSFLAFAMLCIGQQSFSQNVTISVDSVTLACNQSGTVTVPIRMSNFTDIGSVDFTFGWDTQYLTYKYITGFGADFSGLSNVFADFDTSATNVNQGRFTATWSRFGGHTVTTNDAEFISVVFEYNGQGPALLDFPNMPTPVNFTNASAVPVPFDVEAGFVGPIDMDLPVLSCPSNVIIPNAMGAQTTPSSIALNSFSDNCGIQRVGYSMLGATQGTFPTTQDASAQVFQPGITELTYTVTDVGNNTAACTFTVDLQVADDTLTLFTQAAASADCGNSFFVDVQSTNFDTLGSLGFSLDWASGFFRYDSVGMFHPNLNLSVSGNFNENQSQATPNAQLGFSWFTNSLNGTNVPAGETLFRLYFTVIGAAGNTADVVFSDNPTARNAYRQLPYQEIPVRFMNSSIAITDTEIPTISCPPSLTTQPDAGSINATVTGLDPLSIADNCGLTGYSHSILYNGQTSTAQFAADGQYGPGTSVVTYTALDDANNTATCTFEVTVAMVTAAAFDFDTTLLGCKHNDTATVCIRVKDFADVAGVQFAVRWDDAVLEYLDITDVPPAISGGFFFANPTPNTSNELRVVGSNAAGWPDLMDGDTFMCIRFLIKMDGVSSVGIFDSPAYIFEVTDSNGDKIPSSTVGGYVNALDTQAPTFPNCQNDLQFVAPAGQCSRMVDWSAITAADDCGIVDSTATHGISGDVFPVGITQVMFTATDLSGNTASCAFTVEILDMTSPSFSDCPMDLTVNLTNSCMAAGNWTPPVAMDECGVIDSTSNNINPDSLLPVGVYNVAYMAFDTSGNDGGPCSFTLTIQDVDAPVIVDCPNDTTVLLAPTECLAAGNWLAPTLTDACLPVSGGLSSNIAPNSLLPSGMYAVQYNGIDSAGNAAIPCNFSLTIQDTIAPVLSACPSDTTLYVGAACTVMGGWNAPTLTDACLPPGGGLSVNITADSLLTLGMYTVTYTGTDGSDTVRCDFSVTVLDTVAPVLGSCPSDTVSMENPFTYNFSGPTALDNCGMPTIIPSHNSGSSFSNDTTVLIIAEDASGNRDSCSFTVEVGSGCVSNPMITNCPSDSVFVDMGCTASVTYAPELTGFCNPNIDTIITITDANLQTFMNGDNLPVGTYDVVISASTSSDGDAPPCNSTITISETEAPVFNCPTAVILDIAGNVIEDADGFINTTTPLMNCMGAVVDFNMPMAADNCDNSPLATQSGGPLSGDTISLGTVFFEFVAFDDAGNSDTCLTSITVQEIQAFTITASTLEVCPGGSVTLSTDAYPNATYIWSGPGGNFANNNTITIDTFSAANVGTYDLSISTNGCEVMSSDMVTLDIVQMPEARDDFYSVVEDMGIDTFDVVLNDTLVPADYTVSMVAAAQGVTMLNTNGQFSFEGISTPQNIPFSYLLCSDVCPSLCDTGNVFISIKNTRCEFIPNVITPNDDGINDEFLIPCLEFGDYPDASITIYSQWGDVVFEADPYDFDKATAFKGFKDNDPEAVLPDGVYYYIFRTADGDAPYKGFIQLFR